MATFKCWAVILIAVLLSPVATRADEAKEAYEKGKSYLEKKDYDAAIAALTEAIRLDPKNARAYGNRADAYRKKGEFYKAAVDRIKAEELSDNRNRASDSSSPLR